MKYLAKFHSVLDIFLDLLFPKSGLVREIEEMSAAHFVASRRFRGHYPHECANWSRAILAYRDRHVRAAVWELKYRKNAKVAKLFAELLAEELETIVEEIPSDALPIFIVPIPLSEKRWRERGYNQIELILEQLPTNSRWKIETQLLRRKYHTSPQTTLSRAERLKNLDDCFEVADTGNAREKVRGQKIIIIDDVMTTGSTLQQARETLQRAGANEVLAVTLTH